MFVTIECPNDNNSRTIFNLFVIQKTEHTTYKVCNGLKNRLIQVSVIGANTTRFKSFKEIN